MRLDRQRFYNVHRLIYDAVRAVRFAGLETIRNNTPPLSISQVVGLPY